VRVGLTKLPSHRSRSSRGRRRITIAELAPPPILQAPGPTYHLPYDTWKVPVQHIAEPHPYIHRRLSLRGRAASAPPPPLAGDLPGRISTTNRSRVRPITLPARLFASPCLTSPPASAPLPSGTVGENRGHICEDLKIPGACVHKDSIPFYMCGLKLVKSI
jgi:hypothetical protein